MLRTDMVCADSLARPVVALRGGPLAARIGVNAIVRQVFAVPLSPPAARSHLHDRRAVFRGYRRGDGLWDIEAELHDSKTQDFVLPGEGRWAAGEPTHGMAIRLTVDSDTVVHAIEVAMDHFPHGPCPQAMAPMQRMVGSRLARGWRRAIEQHLGGIQGCAHLRELLFNMATAAFQTLSETMAVTMPADVMPPYVGQCTGWDWNGEGVRVHHPQFFGRSDLAVKKPVQGKDGSGPR